MIKKATVRKIGVYNGKFYSSSQITEYYNFTDVSVGDKVSQLMFD